MDRKLSDFTNNTSPESGKAFSVDSPEYFSVHQKPRSLERMPGEVLQVVGEKLPSVIKQYNDRDVPVKKILNDCLLVFKNFRSENGKELYFQQHTASFREMISFLDATHFRKADPSIPLEGSDPEVDNLLEFIFHCKEFLGCVVHFNYRNMIGSADKLYPHDGFGEKEVGDLRREIVSLLERIYIDLLYALWELFQKHAD